MKTIVAILLVVGLCYVNAFPAEDVDPEDVSKEEVDVPTPDEEVDGNAEELAYLLEDDLGFYEEPPEEQLWYPDDYEALLQEDPILDDIEAEDDVPYDEEGVYRKRRSATLNPNVSPVESYLKGLINRQTPRFRPNGNVKTTVITAAGYSPNNQIPVAPSATQKVLKSQGYVVSSNTGSAAKLIMIIRALRNYLQSSSKVSTGNYFQNGLTSGSFSLGKQGQKYEYGKLTPGQMYISGGGSSATTKSQSNAANSFLQQFMANQFETSGESSKGISIESHLENLLKGMGGEEGVASVLGNLFGQKISGESSGEETSMTTLLRPIARFVTIMRTSKGNPWEKFMKKVETGASEGNFLQVLRSQIASENRRQISLLQRLRKFRNLVSSNKCFRSNLSLEL